MNDLVILALPEEAPALINQPGVFFTGVGKVNAAIKVTQLIAQHRPQRVINFGTAGGITVGPGFYEISKFVQRDMQCKELGYAPGQTPFDTLPMMLSTHSHGLVCSTGDNFVNDPQLEVPADVVDMEAYAIAKACQAANVEFVCWKFISDQANADASADWKTMISAGQNHYIAKLQELQMIK